MISPLSMPYRPEVKYCVVSFKILLGTKLNGFERYQYSYVFMKPNFLFFAWIPALLIIVFSPLLLLLHICLSNNHCMYTKDMRVSVMLNLLKIRY
jgi:hypothetical protein